MPDPTHNPGGLIDPKSIQAFSSSIIHPAVSGNNTEGGDGVRGISAGGTGIGVRGAGHTGVHGISESGDGVLGISTSPQHAGVSAINDKGGFGLWARGLQAGHFEGDVAVKGNIQVSGKEEGDAILCISDSIANAAISAINDKGGYGIWVRSERAGHFQGNVTITGSLQANGVVVEAELRQLNSRIASLESRIAKLESKPAGQTSQGFLTIDKESVPNSSTKAFLVSGTGFPRSSAMVLDILRQGESTPYQMQITSDTQGSFSRINTGRGCDLTQHNISYDFTMKSAAGQILATAKITSC